MTYENYSLITLLTDNYQDKNVRKGDVGCIIEVWGNGDYLVDFSDQDGITIALLTLSEAEIQLLNSLTDFS